MTWYRRIHPGDLVRYKPDIFPKPDIPTDIYIVRWIDPSGYWLTVFGVEGPIHTGLMEAVSEKSKN